MKFNIHGKNIEVTDAIRGYIESKIGRLEKYFKNTDLNATVTVRVRGKDQIVEVTIPTDGGNYTASLIISAGCKTFKDGGFMGIGETYYRRLGQVKIEITQADGSTRTQSIVDNTYQFDAQGQMPEIRTGKFDVNTGETIKEVTIWSKNYGSDNNSDDDKIMTMYYSIRLQLDPVK